MCNAFKFEYVCESCTNKWYSPYEIKTLANIPVRNKPHTRKLVYSSKNQLGFYRLEKCPRCMIDKKMAMEFKNKYQLRKIRTDRQPVSHKRQITRERVRRYRERQSKS